MSPILQLPDEDAPMPNSAGRDWKRIQNKPNMLCGFHQIRFALMWPAQVRRLGMPAAPDCPCNLKLLSAEGQTIMGPNRTGRKAGES